MDLGVGCWIGIGGWDDLCRMEWYPRWQCREPGLLLLTAIAARPVHGSSDGTGVVLACMFDTRSSSSKAPMCLYNGVEVVICHSKDWATTSVRDADL